MPPKLPDWTRDEIILACELVARNNWQGVRVNQPAVQELSTLLRSAPIHSHSSADPAFRSANSVQRKTFDIATQHPGYAGKQTRGNRLDREVLREYLDDPERMFAVASAIRVAIASKTTLRPFVEEIEGEGFTATEGVLLLTQHLARERSPRLRREKLRQVEESGRSLSCEVCDFNFAAIYGSIGEGYIEVHHRLPLHESGPTTTRPSDLALVCANCHRVIHRSKRWITPEQLRAMLRTGDTDVDESPIL